MVLELKQIAHIETPFSTKFGVPRQAGLVEARCRVVFEPEFRVAEAVRGLEGFDYVWLLWGFHLNRRQDGETSRRQDGETTGPEDLKSGSQEVLKTDSWSPTVRPPRLGGNKRVGVFATRSPNRPNPIGLSSVKLLSIESDPKVGTVLIVSGADLVDGTPIYDIKPYITYADSHADARSGFAPAAGKLLTVVDPSNCLAALPQEVAEGLRQTLAQDPRPHYQEDDERVYGMGYDGFEVKFRVAGGRVTVVDVGAGFDTRPRQPQAAATPSNLEGELDGV